MVHAYLHFKTQHSFCKKINYHKIRDNSIVAHVVLDVRRCFIDIYVGLLENINDFWIFLLYIQIYCDAPPNFLIDSIASRKVKTTKWKIVGVRSLACSILGVEGHIGALRWGLGRVTSGSIIHTDLHKPNNKLVNA
jgi:hypothetical protein